ncbi:MAG: hypothetical protein KAX49_11745 [Halanaerobiales bacterium]|nr:hypothetical protein [Halanaerobiales bacterium]
MKGTVVIDTREPVYIYDLAKKTLKDYEVLREKLEVGDIQFNNIIIERKTPNDWVSSMRRPSFWSNLFIMKNNYKYPFLYFDGDNEDWLRTISHRKIPFSVIEGSMISVLLTQVSTLSFAKPESAFRFFNTMFTKTTSTKSPDTAKLDFSKRKANLHELRTKNLMCIPRLGNVSAELLLKGGKSIYQIIEDSKEEKTSQEKRIREFFCNTEKKEGN